MNWQKLVFPVTVPEKNYDSVLLKVSAAQGEFEPVSFCVKALEDIDGLSAVLSKPLKNDKGEAMKCGADIGIVECLPKHTTNFEGKNAEFMNGPQYIEPVRPIAVKKDETKQFWVTFEIPEDAAPGKYTGELTLKCENKPDTRLPVEIEVYPFRLAPLEGVNTAMYTSFKNLGGATIEDEISDMRKHGMTSVFAFGENLAAITGKNAESLKIDFEKSRITRVAEAMRKQEFEGDLFLTTGDIRSHANSVAHSGGSFETAYLNIIRQLEAHAKNNGWPNLIYQSFDEIPSNPQYFAEFTKEMTLLKKAGVTTEHDHMWYKTSRPLQAEIDKCVNLVDIFAIRYNSRNLCYVDSWEDIVKKCVETGKGIYPYNSDNACAFAEPSSMRFIGGWFFRTLGNGCGGNFLFIYQWFSGSPYNDFDGSQSTDWMYRYPPAEGRKGGPSIKWEALREGIDDLKYIATLENLIKKCRLAGKNQAAEDAENLLTGIKKSFDLNMLKSKCVFLESKWDREWKDANGKLYASGSFNLPNGWSFEKYNEVRSQIAKKIIELKTELAPNETHAR